MKRVTAAEIIVRIAVVAGQVGLALGLSTIAITQPTLPEPIASLQPLIGLPTPANAAVGGLTITTSGCYPSGGLSKATVQVEVPWTSLVNGQRITVTLTTGSTTFTRTILPESTANPIKTPQVVAFEIDANNAPFTVNAIDSTGSVQTGNGTAPAPCPALVCNAGNLGGQVFNDYDGNGVQAAGENIGVGGVTVSAYDRLGVVYTTTTDTDGKYKFTGIPVGNYPARVEFTSIPAIYGQGTPLGTGNQGTVRFVNAPDCAINLALLNPVDYSEPNPLLVVPVFRRGNPTAPGAPMGSLSTMYAMPANADGTGSDFYSYSSSG